MKKTRHAPGILFVLSIWGAVVGAQEYTISGYVRDQSSGEHLIGAYVYLEDHPERGTTTNEYGFYSLTLAGGQYRIVFSYLGYRTEVVPIVLSSDTVLNVELSDGVALKEVVVHGEDKSDPLRQTEMNVVDLSVQTVKAIPQLMGEADVLKALQLLPGISSANEGSTGLYVRGGGPDQNLIRLDEAVVYHTGHMLGFFSVFNADAIKKVRLYKGGGPARYGGRLSSVLDIRMKEGNKRYYRAYGGIGLISSRLTVEGPLVRDRSSFMVSGRRTYIMDIVRPFVRNEMFRGLYYYFFDLNAKLNYQISPKDRLFISGYFGRDVFHYRSQLRDFQVDMPYGNATWTLRWNHLFNDKLFFNWTWVSNRYDFAIDAGRTDFNVRMHSLIRDIAMHGDLQYYPAPRWTWRAGLQTTYHQLSPRRVQVENQQNTFETPFQDKYSIETGLYIEALAKDFGPWEFNFGLRWSYFLHIGPYTSYLTGRRYASFEPVASYGGLEPRLFVHYRLNAQTSLKASYTVVHQYVHLVSNSTSTLPMDIWVPSSEIVPPQKAWQYSLGLYRSLPKWNLQASVELFYKNMHNQLDYAEHYVPNFERDLEFEFVYGKGRAYGVECYVGKNKGKLTGWLGYTYTYTIRQFDDIENGAPFHPVYDKPHDVAIVLQYDYSPQWQISANWVYGSGRRYTPLKSLYLIEDKIHIRYGSRNSARIEPYHRMDLSISYRSKNPRYGIWTLSVYNLYNRKNPTFIYYDIQKQDKGFQAKAYKVSIFPIIPTVTWSFDFNYRPKSD